MNLKKNILLAFLLIIIALFASCKEENNELPTVELELGYYKEISPIDGRSQITFIDKESLIRQEIFPSQGTPQIIKYIIQNNEIILNGEIILTDTIINYSDTFYFRIINSTKFEIENLYPSLHSGAHTIMIYEKTAKL
jgi:hypothetical protein